jgi:hypothetical protein
MDFFRCTTENVVIVKAVHGELLFGESSTVFYLVLGRSVDKLSSCAIDWS